MWSCTGPDRTTVAVALALALGLGACSADPDAHLAVTRTDSERVTIELCDPAAITTPCKTSELFAATDATDAVKTIDIFVDDGTPSLLARFTQFANPMTICTELTFTFADALDASVALADDAAGATVTGCATCSPIEACAP